MKLIVVIVTYNGMAWIDKCLGSLQNATIKPDVFLVDNGSNDGTQAFVLEKYPEVMFHQSEKNLGFGKANNLGLQYALDQNYDFVYLLNQDAWVEPNTFELLIDCMQRHPEYGILSPLQCQANMKNLDESFLNCLTSLFKKELLSRIVNCALMDKKENEPYEVGMTMAAHWMISRRCLEIVGGFSPTFPHYGEDVNYNDRMHYKKLKMGVVLGAKAVHDRENRKNEVKKLMQMSYMAELVYLSNPTIKMKPWLFRFFSNFIFFVRKYKTLTYLKYLFLVLKNYSLIKCNKKISMYSNCPFLNMERS